MSAIFMISWSATQKSPLFHNTCYVRLVLPIWWSERERKGKKLRETDDKQRNKRLGGRNEKQCRKKKKNIKNKVDEVPNRVQTHIQSRGR